jgi:hypothetical protein
VPTFLNTIVTVTLFTVPVGALMGLIGYIIFSKIENSLYVLIKGKNPTVRKSDLDQ